MIKYILILFVILLVFNSCKEAPTSPVKIVEENFYPDKQGHEFTYEIDTINQVGTRFPIGVRKSMHSGTLMFRNANYVVKKDSTVFSSQTFVTSSYFRKTSAAVYYYVDSSIYLSSIPPGLPDSIRRMITIDPEIIFLSFPLQRDKYWTAFKLSISVFPLIELRVSILGDEEIVLNLNGVEKSHQTKKLHYEMFLSTNLADLTVKQKYTANGWYVNGLGTVKYEGSAFIFSFLTGVNIPSTGAETMIAQQMTKYKF